jgi:hypothetical protein
MSSSRISTQLGNPALLKLLKREAEEQGSTVKSVLTHALECFFAHKLETKALAKISEETFSEWNDPRDSDYDKL